MYTLSLPVQSTLAPPTVAQAPPPAESAVEAELVGDHDGMGLAVGIVSIQLFNVLLFDDNFHGLC